MTRRGNVSLLFCADRVGKKKIKIKNNHDDNNKYVHALCTVVCDWKISKSEMKRRARGAKGKKNSRGDMAAYMRAIISHPLADRLLGKWAIKLSLRVNVAVCEG